MTILEGVLIKLTTGEGTNKRRGSDTDDHLYLGIHGENSGGIEFAIHSERIDNFEKGTTNYYAGLVPNSIRDNEDWNACFVTAQVQQRLLFKSMLIDQGQIDTVYLRKNGTPGGKDDDAYKVKSIEVQLIGFSENQRRTFTRTYSFVAGGGESDGLYLSNETGLKVWLQAGGIPNELDKD